MTIVLAYAFYFFVTDFSFFIVQRSHAMLQNGRKLTRLHKITIMWTLLMYLLKIVHALATVELHTYERIATGKSFTFELVYLILVRTYAYVVDFLTMMTLLYLFYCQGVLAEKKQHQQVDHMEDLMATRDETGIKAD